MSELDDWSIDTPEEQVTAARVKLLQDYPFFSYLAMHLNIKEMPEAMKAQMPTAAVDNKGNFYYCEEFIEDLGTEELMSVIAHEVQHCALEHCQRQESLPDINRQAWGIAADIVVNDILRENGFSLPEDCITPDRDHTWTLGDKSIKKIDEKTVNEIYQELKDKFGDNNGGKQCGNCEGTGKCPNCDGSGEDSNGEECDECGGTGRCQECGGTGKEQSDRTVTSSRGSDADGFDYHVSENGESTDNDVSDNTDWTEVMVEAYEFAKQRGDTPAGMKRYIDEFTNPKFNWKELLYRYITDMIPYDYDWMHPSKKSRACGTYMPSTKREKIEVLVTIDTSGSMWGDFEEGLSELAGLADSFSAIDIEVVLCDAEVQDSYELSMASAEDIKELAMKGGGGTSHIPTYRWIEDNKPNARVVINFTDGYTEFPDFEVGDTIWLVPTDGAPKDQFPFGKVLHLKDIEQ